MHRLDANLTLPHALEPALRLLLRASASASARTGARTGAGALPPGVLESEAHRLVLLRAGEGLAGLRGEGRLAEHGPGGAEDGARRGHAVANLLAFPVSLPCG